MALDEILNDYGLLHVIELNIVTTHSKIPEVNKLLRETEKHLQAAQANLKLALTFKPIMEEK